MKKIVILVIIIMLVLLGISHFENQKKAKSQEDYEKIEILQEACEKVATSGDAYALGSNSAQWYIFELEFIHQANNNTHTVLEKLLGEDFETSLSNGDRLFVGFLPYRDSYRIYAGKPTDENMIYPDWTYKKLSPKE